MGGTASAPTVEIDAPPAAVWGLLLDLPGYTRFMPFTIQMDAASGPLAPGLAITEHVVLDPARPASIRLQRVVVTEVTSDAAAGFHRLCWESVLGARWLLHAVRVHV